MNFYVIRHGQTDYNRLNIYQGQKDIPLNDTGINQAREMTIKLKEIVSEKNINAIIVSPLKRAIQTAEMISNFFNIKLIICDGIKERSFGNLEGREKNPKLTNEMMLDYEKNYCLENIEPIRHLFKRVYETLDSIVEKYAKIEKESGKEVNIVIVTHGAVTIAIDCYFNGKPKVMNYNTLEPKVLKNAQIKVYKR